MEFITPFISQLKNPWQYLCVAVASFIIIFYGFEHIFFVPAIFASLFCGWVLQKIGDFIRKKIANYRRNREILFCLLHLNFDEICYLHKFIERNVQTRAPDSYEYPSHTMDLVMKQIIVLTGNESAGLSFTIPSHVWKIIKRHQDEIFAGLNNEN